VGDESGQSVGAQCALGLGQDAVSIFRLRSPGLTISGSQVGGAAAVCVGPAITDAMDSPACPRGPDRAWSCDQERRNTFRPSVIELPQGTWVKRLR